MRGLSLVCLSLFLPLGIAWPQADTQQKFTVSGTVVSSADNQPVREALVEIVGSGRQTGMTGADGHFSIDGVAAGAVNIGARRPGFEPVSTRPQRFKISGNTDSITLKLAPLGRISGHVLDREGEPIEGVTVQCLAEQMMNGRRQWQPRGAAGSDEAGAFSIENVAAGRYIVFTSSKQLYFAQPKSEAARYVYPVTFYPDAPARDLAQQIEVAPGQNVTLDIALHSTRGVKVSFTTEPAFPYVMATLKTDGTPLGAHYEAEPNKTGSFTFSGVPTGSWTISVRGPFGMRDGSVSDGQFSGELPIQVGSADLENLKIPLSKLAEIPVSITGVANPSAVVQILSKEGMINGSNQDKTGAARLSNVEPGTYRAVVPFTGGNSCIVSMTSGGLDLMRDELVVAPGSQPAPIQIVESANCAQLAIGTNTQENVQVIVTRDNSVAEPRLVMARNGTATVNSLSEGDYKIYAFDDVSGLEYANPEAMRDYKSQSAHLEAGQKATAQLEVNERRPK